MLKDRPPSCYSASQSGRLSAGRRQWIVSAWCRGNSIVMTRTSRWRATPGRWRLSPGGRDASLPRRWWPQQGPGRRWWPWLVCNEPSLWANRRWRGLSCNCFPSNPSKLVDQWQNPSIIPSSGGWVPARIVSPHKAYGGLLSRPGIRRIPSRSPRHHGGALASSISGQQVLVFSRSQNDLLVGRRDACWWALSGWFPGRRGGLGGIARRWGPPNLRSVPSWSSGLACLRPAVCIASVSYLRQHRAILGLALFVDPAKIVGAGVKRRSHRWKLGAGVMGGRMKMRPKNWVLLSWHWSINSVSGERFGHS